MFRESLHVHEMTCQMPSVLTEREENRNSLVKESYSTKHGKMLVAKIEDALLSPCLDGLVGKVNLIFTSPPFPLIRKKSYSNKTGEDYLKWLSSLAPLLTKLLAPDGSIVIEVGNAWEQGAPVMSTLPLEALLAFKNAADLNVCQQIICHNPARLPSPAQWVTVNRVRLKDSYTHVWWMSKTESPKADNRRVLTPYGDSMRKLLKSKSYNAGRRPSGHVISEKGFLMNHGGAISPSVIDVDESSQRLPESLMKFAGTSWDKGYRDYCKRHNLEMHPARMPVQLAAFFIQFLTEPGDLVLDPFAGSNTTGFASEILGRRWISVEANVAYAEGSKGRFEMFNDADDGASDN